MLVRLLATSVAILLAMQVGIASPLHNQLTNNPSPYLAMHGHDPVAWQEWNAEAIARARRENKLLYVSSGYFSCHWCHVMQRESYRNPAIAAILNKYFIPVKVDRELNPALDAHLIDFVERTQGISGWPLNTFVTPAGYPLVGMVYVPADNFLAVLKNLSGEWQHHRLELAQLAERAALELETQRHTKPMLIGPDAPAHFRERLFHATWESADELQGGFGQENKFPSAPQMYVLLRLQKINPEPRLEKFLHLTLMQMATQGLRDQLGGGFFRYVVDPAWQVPHFEKMLYDNALMAVLNMEAAQVLHDPVYASVARETLDFLLREMRNPDGSFMASFSAVDGQGSEGGYYLWQPEQVRQLLTKQEATAAIKLWQVQGAPELEAGHHLVQAMSIPALATQMQLSPAQLTQLLDSAREKLYTARSKRSLPKDTKVLAGWNGLALSAFIKGAIKFPDKDYRAAAVRLRRFIQTSLWRDGRLLRSIKQGGSGFGQAGLEDYAYVGEALYEYAKWTGDEADWRLAHELVSQAWNRFYSAEKGWRLSENSLLKYGEWESLIAEGAMPSSSAVLMAITQGLAEHEHDDVLRHRVLGALQQGGREIETAPFWHAQQIMNLLETPAMLRAVSVR